LVSERILGYRPWIREDPALIDLDARWRTIDPFGDYRQILTYGIWWSLGWPCETSVAMARLVYSGCFDRHPCLAVITQAARRPDRGRRHDRRHQLARPARGRRGGDLRGQREEAAQRRRVKALGPQRPRRHAPPVLDHRQGFVEEIKERPMASPEPAYERLFSSAFALRNYGRSDGRVALIIACCS